MQPHLESSNFQLLAGHLTPAWCWDVPSDDYLQKKTEDQQQEGSSFVLTSKLTGSKLKNCLWVKQVLPVLQCPRPLCTQLWAEKSCLWWGPCLYYLWLPGVPNALQEMQGLGKEPFEEELLGRVMRWRRLSSATSFALTASIWVLGLAQPLHLFARVHIHSFTSSLPSPKYTQEYTGALLLGHAEVTPFPEDLKNMWENGLQIFPCIFSLWEGWEPICRRTVFVILKLGSVLDNSTLSTHLLGGLN